MKSGQLTLFSILPILLLITAGRSSAQAPQRDNRPRTASVSGRVTIAGKPAANAVITVTETDLKPDAVESGLRLPIHAKTRTDGDGRYLVGGLAEGRYVVSAMLKAFVAAGFDDPNLSRTVTLDEGEAREKIDFALIRGGVMTGKVIDDEGAPLIARRVQLYKVDEQGQKIYYQTPFSYEMFQTDDRGRYRIYGLVAGRYMISAGGQWASGLVGRKSSETFYPDATDQSRAKIIEVKEGAEVTDIDIRLGVGKDTYAAAGRVVDAETGQPLPRVSVLCMEAPDKKSGGTRHGIPATTDDEGRFRCANLSPGPYQLSFYAMIRVSQYEWSGAPGMSGVTRRVTVSGAETVVNLTLGPAPR